MPRPPESKRRKPIQKGCKKPGKLAAVAKALLKSPDLLNEYQVMMERMFGNDQQRTGVVDGHPDPRSLRRQEFLALGRRSGTPYVLTINRNTLREDFPLVNAFYDTEPNLATEAVSKMARDIWRSHHPNCEWRDAPRLKTRFVNSEKLD